MAMKKKAMLDTLFWIMAIFVLAILGIICYYILTSIYTGFDESGTFTDDPTSLALLGNLKDKYAGIVDTLFTATFFGIVIFILISSFYVRSSPIFLFVGVLALILFTYFGMILSGTYSEITTQAELVAPTAAFTVIPYVMENFHFFILGIAAIVGIILYGKRTEI